MIQNDLIFSKESLENCCFRDNSEDAKDYRMLWGFGARNCWCFKEWMEIDFSLNENVPKDVSMGLPVATALCLKGANASGKTSALKVLSFIVFFATQSFSLKPEDSIPFESFFNNNNASEFYITFSCENILYRC